MKLDPTILPQYMNEKNLSFGEVRHTETISFAQIRDDEKYRAGLVSNIHTRTAEFSELEDKNKVTYLNVLHQLGRWYNQDSFYPDTITKLWKTKQLEAVMPKIDITDSDLENLIRFYTERRLKGSVSQDGKKVLAQSEKDHPSLFLNDGLMAFGPLLQTDEGQHYSVGITELG